MKILAFSDVHGEMDNLQELAEKLPELDADLAIFCGDIVGGKARAEEWLRAYSQGEAPRSDKPEILEERERDIETYVSFLRTLGHLGLPVAVVPGNMDAPEDLYLRIILAHEVVEPGVNLVHHGFMPAGRNLIIAGLGGEITETERESRFVLRYPRWETEFAFNFLRYLPQEKILVFHSPPKANHIDLEGDQHKGSQVVAEVIKTHRPLFAFCGHAHEAQGQEWVGNTLVVNPGALKHGYYAVMDTTERQAEFHKL